MHFNLFVNTDLELSYVLLHGQVSKDGPGGFSLIELFSVTELCHFSQNDSVTHFGSLRELRMTGLFVNSFKGLLQGKKEAEPWLYSSHWLVMGQL